MSQFAEDLRSQTSSWASAYLQYQTGKGREGYRCYAFVEDEDDKSYYELSLSQYENVCYLGCGGKTGVVSVYKKLSTSDDVAGNMFFVDRDTERSPYSDEENILRTARYSWESDVCDPAFVGWLLQRKLVPNLTLKEKHDVIDAWVSSIESFRSLLVRHTSLCRTAVVLDQSLGLSEVVFWSDATSDGLRIAPGPSAENWHSEKLELAVALGATADRIDIRINYFDGQDVYVVARGKTLFNLLRKFVSGVQSDLGRGMRGQLNSARAWVEAMPWTDERLQYIRDYAVGRIGPP